MNRIIGCLLLATFTFVFSNAQNFRSYDGRGNNLNNPTWGSVDEPLVIETALDYSDGMQAANGQNRPNPRTISNVLFSQDSLLPDVMKLSDYTWAFGQFIDHDITITPPDSDENISINVPSGDLWFDPDSLGTALIPMSRTNHIDGTGEDVSSPRLISNLTTAFIDGSSFYGHNQEISSWLRTYRFGKLKSSEGGLLPYNTITGEFDSDIDPNAPHMDDEVGLSVKHFIAGDVRANENPILISFHTLFIREHNRLCDELRAVYLNWQDERIYQEARKRTVAIMNAIIYEEWLPTMGIVLPEYQGYDNTVNSGISNVFTVAAFRMGHTLLSGNIMRLDNDGNPIPEGDLALKDAFFNPLEVPKVGGIEPYFKGMGAQVQQKFDAQLLDDVRNFLFADHGSLGMDLASLNIARGRERGVPDYNTIREHYGMGRVSSFSEINSSQRIIDALNSLYDSVDDIDPWVGMLCEEREEGSIFGPLVIEVLKAQFQNLRDGDRYFYQNDPHLTDAEKEEYKNTRLYDVLMRNTNLSVMQPNVFEAVPHDEICIAQEPTADITGQVYREDGELLKGVALQVSHTSGNQVSQSLTGDYAFSDLATCEKYNIRADKPESVYEGVSTFDIVRISKHVLNVDLLDSPYKILAADVNESGSVTTLDIVGIRKIVLRAATEFQNQKVWAFVPADHQFDLADIWTNPIPDKATVKQFDSDKTVDFVAYKMGDVDNSFIIEANSVEDRTMESFVLAANNIALEGGNSISIPIYATENASLMGMQFSIVPESGVEVESIRGVALQNIEASNYSINEEGILVFSWNEDVELKKGEVLFDLTISVAEDIELKNSFNISSEIIAAETYNKIYQTLPLSLEFESMQAEEGFMVYQNYPNPFSNVTTIRFNLPAQSEVKLEIFDLSGRKVISEKGVFENGLQSIEVSSANLKNSGIYHYQISSDFGTETRKMIIVE